MSDTTTPISLFISDVDGTLLTPDKSLTPATIATVQRLHALELPFTLVSSRPPQGFAMLIEPLALNAGLKLPLAAFNGGMIIDPQLTCLGIDLLPRECTQETIETMRAQGLEVWLYTETGWYVTEPDGAYVAHEIHAIKAKPITIADFSGLIDKAAKLVGSSKDFAKVAACEQVLAQKLQGKANAHRSQAYYIDVTPLGADKGHAVEKIASICGVPLAEVAVLGDMENDLPMFAKAGVAIAMGNATEAVKAKADAVTGDNQHDGFAEAVTSFILPRVRSRPKI